jgi:tight adherence protein C
LRPKLLGAGTWLVAGGSLWIGNRLPTAGLLLGVVGAYCLPDLVLVHAVKRRLQQLRAGFLAALDLLASTAAGGHGLHACLHMVGPRLPGPIRVVVGAALREIDAGRRIHQALAAAGQRSGLTELVTLAGALEEAESLGTPVTTTLRELASGLRVDRRNALEAQASALPLKLSVCTIAFFLPPILVLLVLPNVLGFLGTPW